MFGAAGQTLALPAAVIQWVVTDLREDSLFCVHTWKLHCLYSWNICFPSESPVELMENFLLAALGQEPNFYLLFIFLPH